MALTMTDKPAARTDRTEWPVALQEEFARGGALQRLLLRYTQALVTHISQTAACNRPHCGEKRLGRLLLLIRDRLQSNDLPMTQESLSHMLGGRRESVTVAAGHLQDAGPFEQRTKAGARRGGRQVSGDEIRH